MHITGKMYAGGRGRTSSCPIFGFATGNIQQIGTIYTQVLVVPLQALGSEVSF